MKIKLAQLQLPVSADRQKNLDGLAAAMDALEPDAPDLVAAGEMFVCPYDAADFPKYAEPEGGETWRALSAMAAAHRAYLSAGTVPELDEHGHIYNTAYVFDRSGRQIAKHRKAHLFDIDVRGGQSFRESETLSAGDRVTVFDTEFGPVGLCVCFDIRFPELARLMALRGARLVLVPAAFNMTTGPAHWELNFRARALDNQCWYAGTSVARDKSAAYQSWGHSILVSPWGDVVGQLGEAPGTMLCAPDLDTVEDIRAQLPLLSARRTDIYDLRETGRPAVTFRRAGAQDIDRIEAIYDELHAEEEAGRAVIGWRRGVYPTREDAAAGVAVGDMFVAEADGVIAASARINLVQPDMYKDGAWRWQAADGEVMVMHTLTVSPSAGHLGIGTRFVRFYEQYARERGCRYLRIDTQEKNARARAMYARMGFREADIVPCEFCGIPDVSLVLLEKAL